TATLTAAHVPMLVKIDGDDRDARPGVAEALAAALGHGSLVIRAAALPPVGAELAGVALLVDREALLLDAVPVVEADERDVSAFVDELQAPLVIVVGDTTARVRGRAAL